MQHYRPLQKAHSHHTIMFDDGSQAKRYSRYEKGIIQGDYRDIQTLIADEKGFDGLGVDATVGSNDDKYAVFNLWDDKHRYIDTVAINGACDIDHAEHLALTQFDYLDVDYVVLVANEGDDFLNPSFDSLCWSSEALARLANNRSQDAHYLPIINQKMLLTEQNRVTANAVMWDGANLSSHGQDYKRLLVDLQKHDSLNELTHKFDMAEALADMQVSELGLDALMDTNNRLDLMKERLFNALVKQSIDDLSVTDVTLTKPFKKAGVANVAMQFDLSDGQTFTIFFHNPDADPKKLAPQDMMVSWKWLLNKRDVTAAVSPKNGDNVQLPSLAMRIMKVAKANSKRFAAAQGKKAENQKALADAKQAVDDKTATLNQLNADIADLQGQIEEASKVQAVEVATPSDGSVNANNDTALIDIRKSLLGNQADNVNQLYKKNIQLVTQRYQDFLNKTNELRSQIQKTPLEFDDFIANGDFSYYGSYVNASELYANQLKDMQQAKDDLVDIINDDKDPKDIVGSGVKTPKNSAMNYLVKQIADSFMSLKDKKYYEKYQANYVAYLKDLIDEQNSDNQTTQSTDNAEPSKTYSYMIQNLSGVGRVRIMPTVGKKFSQSDLDEMVALLDKYPNDVQFRKIEDKGSIFVALQHGNEEATIQSIIPKKATIDEQKIINSVQNERNKQAEKAGKSIKLVENNKDIDSFIKTYFVRDDGTEFLNNYNRNKLIQFLSGEDENYQGSVNNSWQYLTSKLPNLIKNEKIDFSVIKQAYTDYVNGSNIDTNQPTDTPTAIEQTTTPNPTVAEVKEDSNVNQNAQPSQLKELDTATKNRLQKTFFDGGLKVSSLSDEATALMALVIDRAGGVISEKDLGNLFGSTNRLFDGKPLNDYYLKGEYALSQPIIDAYNKVLGELDSIKSTEVPNYIFQNAVNAKVSIGGETMSQDPDTNYLNSVIDGSIGLSTINMKEVIAEIKRIAKAGTVDKDLLNQAIEAYQAFALSVKVA